MDQVTDTEGIQVGSQSEGTKWREEWDVEKRGECPFPSSADLPVPGIESTSPALEGRFFTAEPPGTTACTTGLWTQKTQGRVSLREDGVEDGVGCPEEG